MTVFLDWFGGRRRAQVGDGDTPSGVDPYALLSARLGDYPPDRPLHPGRPKTLTQRQRAENLAHFLARDEERIAIIMSRLAREGLDAASVPDGDVPALAQWHRIDEWLARWVTPRPFDTVRGDAEPNPPFARWFASDRTGPGLVFSFVSDLARLNAAAIRRADPLFAWTMVESDIDAALTADPVANPDGEPSDLLHRLCLVRHMAGGSVPTVLDLPIAVLALVHQRMSPLGLPVQNTFPIGLEAVRAGAYRRR